MVPGSWGHEKEVSKFKRHHAAFIGISIAGIVLRQSFNSANASV